MNYMYEIYEKLEYIVVYYIVMTMMTKLIPDNKIHVYKMMDFNAACFKECTCNEILSTGLYCQLIDCTFLKSNIPESNIIVPERY